MSVTIKNNVLRDVTPWSLVDKYRLLGGACKFIQKFGVILC
jgi:hypothetical protein